MCEVFLWLISKNGCCIKLKFAYLGITVCWFCCLMFFSIPYIVYKYSLLTLEHNVSYYLRFKNSPSHYRFFAIFFLFFSLSVFCCRRSAVYSTRFFVKNHFCWTNILLKILDPDYVFLDIVKFTLSFFPRSTDTFAKNAKYWH